MRGTPAIIDFFGRQDEILKGEEGHSLSGVLKD